jgi:zinc D-Ala-D-Ala carboxypeptidase
VYRSSHEAIILSNSDRSKQLNRTSPASKTGDIPAAVRSSHSTAAPSQKRKSPPIVGIAVGSIVAAFGATGYNFYRTNQQLANVAASPNANTNSKLLSNTSTNPSAETGKATGETVLGHFAYAEAPTDKLMGIDGGFKLRKSAAKKYQAMVAAARSAGVNLTTISAFRSVQEQQRLFFEVGAQRAQQPKQRAEVSAPPKHSEHHTGYALDLGDTAVPSANLNQNFENTPAYKWLTANAARYGFELSFPKNNAQGVSYEPWHWRFVGDSDSLETFYKARKTTDRL